MDWINSYNDSSLSASSVPTDSVLAYANECNAIISSSLKRSIDSANALDSEKYFLSESLFIEAGLPSTNGSFLKLYPNHWAVLFRFLWLFGYSNNSESFKEAKLRANTATNKLVVLAQEYEQVLFVGHGFFNRLIVKELMKRGWLGSKNPGSGYWSIDTYAYPQT